MTSIKKTAPKIPTAPAKSRAPVSSCGPMTPTERAASSCGGWVSKSTRGKAEKKVPTGAGSVGCGWSAPARKPATVSSCGSQGYSRWGKLPSGC